MKHQIERQTRTLATCDKCSWEGPEENVGYDGDTGSFTCPECGADCSFHEETDRSDYEDY